MHDVTPEPAEHRRPPHTLGAGLSPRRHPELQTRLGRIGDELIGVIDELRELARGIHPAVLS